MRLLAGPRFPQLLCNPESTGISVADYEKAIQNAKRERWDGKEVHRSNGLTMIPEKRQPSARTSLLTHLRPPTCLALETHVQYKRNPARCQLTTVLAVTKTRGFVHPDQNVLNATQNSLCMVDSR
jgi:hypothetical protein